MKRWLIVGILIGIMIGILFTFSINRYYAKIQSEAAYAYGVSLLSNNKIEAIAVFNQAIGIDHKNYKPYIALGKIYENEGHFELSLEFYKKAMQLCINDTAISRSDKKFIDERIKALSR
jgi:tetratricopeptide (TPR) repeat protein